LRNQSWEILARGNKAAFVQRFNFQIQQKLARFHGAKIRSAHSRNKKKIDKFLTAIILRFATEDAMRNVELTTQHGSTAARQHGSTAARQHGSTAARSTQHAARSTQHASRKRILRSILA
jgi:hypothetical protein